MVALLHAIKIGGKSTMKRRISALLSMLLVCCLVFAGCSSKENEKASLAGSWKIISLSEETSGLELTGDQLEAFGFGDYSIELKEDGSLSATIGEEATEGTYTVEDNSISVTIDNETITGQIEDNKITISDSGATLVLEKDNQ
jgi:C-terminal lipocalin-like domain